MFTGKLEGICTAPAAGAPMQTQTEIEAVAGKGLVGDRYAEAKGSFQKGDIAPDQQITLIESEALLAAQAELGVELCERQARRNLLTSGVPLNHLVDREFRVGQVVLRGIRLCEPCNYLENRTLLGARQALLHRGGLRAQIVVGGVLRVGDPITPAS